MMYTFPKFKSEKAARRQTKHVYKTGHGERINEEDCASSMRSKRRLNINEWHY